jgi:low affinity Fe/Cu permease
MKSILLFLIIQSLYFLFGLSDANQLSVIVLSTAIVIFVSSYIAVLIKERRHKQNLVNALLNSN